MSIIKSVCTKLFVLFIGIFIRRDKKVMLFGSWMSERYADNSRFLYEYLSLNKEKYKLKRVIWVSNNEEIVHELQNKGFEVYKINSKQIAIVYMAICFGV